MTYPDHMLRAYLDGVLPDAQTADLTAALAQDRALEQQIMGLDAFFIFMHIGMDDLWLGGRIARQQQVLSQMIAGLDP